MQKVLWTMGDKPTRSSQKDNPSLRSNVELNMTPESLLSDKNKREQANEKLNERYLIGRQATNPYLAKNSYINDLNVQENYLIPRNTNK